MAEDIDRRAAMPREASIFSAELHAIQMAVDAVRIMQQNMFLIISDFMNVQKELGNRVPEHPVARKFQHVIKEIKARGKQGELCWAPGHAGIAGNERANAAAKAAAR